MSTPSSPRIVRDTHNARIDCTSTISCTLAARILAFVLLTFGRMLDIADSRITRTVPTRPRSLYEYS
eukprot:scaffold457218_cov33-Prasinocladus_malaysianus.AAC.1